MKKVSLSAYASAVFTPRKYSWYLFLLEAESTAEPQCGKKDDVNAKSQRQHAVMSQRAISKSTSHSPLAQVFVFNPYL
jgi:hypothetical protein